LSPAPAGPAKAVRLRQRREFLAAARGLKLRGGAFLLQAVPRSVPGGPDEFGIGITVTRKIGNAVTRNRARRRLREALRQAAPGRARPGHDYVVVARPAALSQTFAELTADLARSFESMAVRLARQPGAA
jgi:ribonuclease P protein component